MPHSSEHSVTTVHVSARTHFTLHGCVLQLEISALETSSSDGQLSPRHLQRVALRPPPHSELQRAAFFSFRSTSSHFISQSKVLQGTSLNVSSTSVQGLSANAPSGGGSMSTLRICLMTPPPHRAEQPPQFCQSLYLQGQSPRTTKPATTREPSCFCTFSWNCASWKKLSFTRGSTSGFHMWTPKNHQRGSSCRAATSLVSLLIEIFNVTRGKDSEPPCKEG
mmetsp:Transcript_45724/g.82724  ORF Transcript_45724/g.82724 Transcript_45724/m.82724 type:complete len:222 (-) Transcript_45724:637-1302(-)